MSRSAPFALLALVGILLSVPSPAPAARNGSFAGTLGVKVPEGAQASVRAISSANGVVAGRATVGRTGRFNLSLPSGRYLVVGSVVAESGKVTTKRVGLTLKPGQRRRGAKLTARRTPRRRARSAFVQERGQATPGQIAVAVHRFTGATGDRELDTLARGIADLVIVDVLNGVQRCGGVVLVERIRLADVLRELEFQQSPYVDPSTRVTRNMIREDVEVRGTLGKGADGRPVMTMRTTEVATGRVLQTYEMAVGDDPFAVEETLARRLSDDLCKLSDTYEVTLDVAGAGRFATHEGTGTIQLVLRARRTDRAARVWTAEGPLQWTGVSFTSKTPPCVMVDPIVPTVAWNVRLEDAGDGQLEVTWGWSGNDGPTASIDCPPGGPDDPDPPPQPGLPGPALLGSGPTTFTIPYAGAATPVGGGISDQGDGWFNTGTLTIRPKGVG